MALVEDPEGHELDALARVQPSFAGLRVLEIGAGDGRLTGRYAAGAGAIVAIDPDGDDIAALRDALPGIDARAIGVESLDLADASVDVVLFAWSL
ncbi:MAG TPA: methyltransferase domain-containing protein [Vicinamibacterales bacterium]|nr:methyltransferase domain-containing protein [Vicinamibacterales bacterium]